MEGYAVINLGALECEAGNYQVALGHSAAAVELLRQVGDESGLNVALANCGWATFCLGDPAGAMGYFRDALLVATRVQASHRIAGHALPLGAALVAVGKAERGTRLMGAGTALCEALDVPVFDDKLEERVHGRAVADARSALGEEAFAAAWADGRTMTLDDVVRFAVDGP
jgi:hypothetical protein